MSNSLPETLFLRLSGNALHMARYDADNPTNFAYSAYRLNPQISLAANLREAGRTEELMQAPLRGMVQVLVDTPVTYVPLADFEEDHCESTYNLCYPPEGRRRIFYDVVANINTVVLFSLREGICRALEDYFESVNYVSTLTALVRYFATKGLGQTTEKREFVYLSSNHAHVFVYEGSRFLMGNSFATHNQQDTVYFALNIAQQMGLKLAPQNETDDEGTDERCDRFYVAGETTNRNAIAEMLKDYAVNVVNINASAEFNRHPAAAAPDIPYDLVTLLLANTKSAF